MDQQAHRIANRHEAAIPAKRDWRRKMSDHVASALLVYTGLQIFVTVQAMAEGLPSMLPYLALVILVAGIIPACRAFERRWAKLDDAAATDPAMKGPFVRDAITLWVIAIGLPFVITFAFKLAYTLF
ncbi:hypothetical protein F7D01_08895 [Erythrobacter sp. 3-20A1M]|uniref:hypothetical protein n=1 Tax=Erythrobacter sp. 3-20A1M TaxID=2653850 RepID=UPI001BFC4532|nr:hypothetical protein [Erythrobacter sp. 3-20A1M]QWC58377.1 hypothetical protein F7D01_08895 [Erythrobacter sp. 3-20A1M]|tara:strand:+ start:181 stop:561 length:381 start_codon:yes stop_codon:yes gene_type:complete